MSKVESCSGCNAALQPPAEATSFRCPFCWEVTPVHVGCSLRREPPPPAPGGRKKAVICGVSYLNSNNKLGGSITDVNYMEHLLISRFDFPAYNILKLTEEETDPSRIPTKHNIIEAMKWLVADCQAGDSLFFHFSGHGKQEIDNEDDEIDGYNETLCPSDFIERGEIIDNEINEILVRPIPPGVKLHAVIDACHSGTALDLPYLCRMNRTSQYVWEDHRPPSGAWKGSSGGQVISFSGCDDSQESFDSALLSTVASGIMTRFFVEAIEHGHSATYGSILNYIRSSIRSIGINHEGGVIPSTSNMPVARMRQQEPQLTSCHQFDVYAKPFSL